MKAFPVVKSFTAVLIFLVSVSSLGEDAVKPNKCIESCNNISVDCAGYAPGLDGAVTCRKTAISDCKKECKSDERDRGTKCEAAVEKFTAAEGAGAAACKAFDKTLVGSCSEKMEACNSKINGVFEEPIDKEENGTEMLLSIVKQKMIGSATPSGGTNACVKPYDSKEAKADKKDLDQKARDLKKDIKKEADEQLKFKEEQAKKANEIEKQIATLKKDLKKFSQAKDSDMRKQINEAGKMTLDSAKKLRGLNLSIVKANNELAQLRFRHQTEMLDLTDERVTFSCKQQLLSLKNGILNSSGEDTKSPNYSEKKALADQFRNQGAKGTADLKALLVLTQKKCFETANTKKNQTTLQFSQSQSDINNNIKEIQNQIDDEKKQLALSQDNIKKIQDEADTEKKSEEAAIMKEIENLNKEAADNERIIGEKLATSRAQAIQLNMDIQNLALKTNEEVEFAYSDAYSAIAKAKKAKQAVTDRCCMGEDKKKNSSICGSKDESDIGDSKKSTDSRSKTTN